MGTGGDDIRFSWIMRSNMNNTTQTSYHLQVSKDPEFQNDRQIVWDTDREYSDQSIHIQYQGIPLESQTRYYWRVQVQDNHGNSSVWSEASFFETGLLNPSEWKVKWIQTPFDEDTASSQPVTQFRSVFKSKKEIQSARLYASAHGLYEIEINGKRVGDQVFTPGWTSYASRVPYQTYDITDFLQMGENAVGAYLADGWYRGFLGWEDQRNYYGEKLAFIAQIHITYEDGSTLTTGTDENWKALQGPIRKSDIYKGEYYDARLEMPGWSKPGFKDRDWQKVKVAEDIPMEKLIAWQSPPVKKIQELKPVSWFVTPAGDTVLDMGQNMIGWMKIRVSAQKGTKIELRHAETLDKQGNFYTANLRSADQLNTYVLKGEGLEEWEPRFTFQGFRYVAVSGWPGDFNTDDFTGMVIHSDMEPTGHFESSNPLINQLQHNIVWGQKGNFLEIPTDCPQRDERMGWTGDIQVFANTASLQMHTAAFLKKWLDDLSADQLENGAVPHVIPNVLGDNAAGAAGWGDAAAVVTWSVFQAYNDTLLLKKQYKSVKKWVEYMRGRAALKDDPYIWTGDYHFGDWLAYATIDRPDYAGSYTHTDLIATAYFAHSTHLALKMSEILNIQEDKEYFTFLYENVKNAFRKEFVTPNGRLTSDTQTAYLLALQFDLLPENRRKDAAAYLVNDVRRRGHLTTGFLGTPHLNHVLSEFGYEKEAYDLLLRTRYPSWLYPVKMGATTIWERWDGIKPDSTFQSPAMNSFNHYAYGAIAEWMYREIAGIKHTAPAYKTINISPNPGGGITHARAFQNTPYGRVLSQWNLTDKTFELEVVIPANTNATIVLPNAIASLVNMNNVT
ncbi:MAG: family 78 glycoside hydrolase catalytic domain, partial [Bacteroidota bacterium]